MEIMKNDAADDVTVHESDGTPDDVKNDSAKNDGGIFSEGKISEESTVQIGDMPGDDVKKRDVVITPSDKAAFIDAIVSNDRFKKEYSMFGADVRRGKCACNVDREAGYEGFRRAHVWEV